MTASSTPFTALLGALEAAAQYDKNDQARPAAILWTDKEAQWAALLPRLRAAFCFPVMR